MGIYLVTGGAGFIGSHLVAELLARGRSVRVVDDLSTGILANVPAGAEFIAGDLTDSATAVAALRDVEVVLHQAAMPSVPLSIVQPRASHESNINATFNILMAARDAGARRVVFASSSSTYGNSPKLPKVEDMATNPLSPYALQKQVGESYGQLFNRFYGLDTVSTRYFNVFGPRQHPFSPYSGVLSLFIKAALSGTSPTIYGDGEQTRDFTYVDNVIDGVLRAADAPDVAGQVINIATGVRISLNEAWAALGEILGGVPDPAYEPPRAGDTLHSQADITKAERLLGYRPHVAFRDGLRRTVEWAQAAAGNPWEKTSHA